MDAAQPGLAKYPHVFRPIRLGPVEMKNRFYFSPHGTAMTAASSPSDDFAFYYGERALGGVALGIQSLAVGHRQIARVSPQDASRIDSFGAVADMMHAHGAKLFGQLHHSWPTRLYQWEPLGPAAPSLSSSVHPRFDHFSSSHAMSRDEIKAWIRGLAECARNLAEAGLDGIQVHVTHGLLLEHFISPYYNRRTDEYGGSVENRARIVIEALEATKAAIKPSMALGIRYMCDELVPGGLDQDQSMEILARLVDTGLMDYVDLDIAIEPDQFILGMPSYFLDPLPYESFVRHVRQAAGDLPVLSALGRVTTIAQADRAIAEGSADMVGAARGLIAEPELVNQALEGREDESRQCIACNWCLRGDGWGCSINPQTAKERRWGIRFFDPAPRQGTVVVVGAGPAGLEAARTAARKGHRVVLFEQKPHVGGLMHLWGSIPGREVMLTTPAWYEREVRRLGVDLRLGVAATAETILAEDPIAVIVATGSRFDRTGMSGFMPAPVPGWDRDLVLTPEQILEEGLRPSGRILIVDDEAQTTAAGIAEILADAGAEVEIITRWLQPVTHLVDRLEFAFVIPRLRSRGVKITTETWVKEVGDREVTVFDVFLNIERVIEHVDHVIFTTMRLPIDGLVAELEGKVPQLFAVGDALAPRSLAEATHEGHRFARLIGEPGAPSDFTEAWWEPAAPEAFPRPAAVLRQARVPA
jgi:2,4-dienoyl-CoA reductase-like NADH-dependent reductase (Old Yellow Enzyme family)